MVIILILITAIITFNIFFIVNQIDSIGKSRKEGVALSNYRDIKFESRYRLINLLVKYYNKVISAEKYQNLLFTLNIISIATCLSIFMFILFIVLEKVTVSKFLYEMIVH